MRRSPLRSLTKPGAPPLALSRGRPCPRDTKCSCLNNSAKARTVRADHAATSIPLHMDDCNDPSCVELEQLKSLQKSLDHFTDYDHYERCCDGHLHTKHASDECCIKDGENHHKAAEQCDDCCDDCEQCVEEHEDCYEEVAVCDDDCEECEEECEEQGHEPENCPRDHPTTRDNCTPACEVPHNPLPQLGPTDVFDAHGMSDMAYAITPCTEDCAVPLPPALALPPAQFLGSVFDNEMDHWQTFVQSHHCAPDPCVIGQPPQSQLPHHTSPSFGFTFGCDPMLPGNQYPWQASAPVPQCNPLAVSLNSSAPIIPPFSAPVPSAVSVSAPSVAEPKNTTSEKVTSTAGSSRTCEWLMPCGSICGASFARTEDLKKHIKNSHSTKGTVTCRWNNCTASFATEAALTGHISKKHLTISEEEGPWKCTYPGCTKSFMYKQVRDDHLASHNGGNRMHCPICHQWLNCEGSNFRRHMASHGPKNEYMKCRFENLGCKKRFPRLDNLRRHEACCKWGKKAAGVHHHHHRVHIGHAG